MSNASHRSVLASSRTKKSDSGLRVSGINTDKAVVHHDALEFPDGQLVLLTRLIEGQHATVLQLPAAAPHPTEEPPAIGRTNRVRYPKAENVQILLLGVEHIWKLECSIDPNEIMKKAGDGAECTFETGQ
jgi:hypothetical protein